MTAAQEHAAGNQTLKLLIQKQESQPLGHPNNNNSLLLYRANEIIVYYFSFIVYPTPFIYKISTNMYVW